MSLENGLNFTMAGILKWNNHIYNAVFSSYSTLHHELFMIFVWTTFLLQIPLDGNNLLKASKKGFQFLHKTKIAITHIMVIIVICRPIREPLCFKAKILVWDVIKPHFVEVLNWKWIRGPSLGCFSWHMDTFPSQTWNDSNEAAQENVCW